MTLIVIDPGHGGHDGGAVGNGIVEKDLALRIGLRTRDFLSQRYVVDVRMTRETDVFISLSGRAQFANRLNADYFVSLHHNAGGGEGFESYIFRGTQSTQTRRAQEVVHQEIMNYLRTVGARDRGRKEANFAVLRETTMPAILLENFFVDHPLDAELLKNPVVIDQLSLATATGIAKAFALRERNSVAPQTPASSIPAWKAEPVEWLFQEGFLTDPTWKNNVDQPLPLWAVAVILQRMREKLKP